MSYEAQEGKNSDTKPIWSWMLSPSSDCRGRREDVCAVFPLHSPTLHLSLTQWMTCWQGCYLYFYPQCISLVRVFAACPWTSLSFQYWQYVLSCSALLVPTGQGNPAITNWRSQVCRSYKSAQNDYLHSDHLSVSSLHSLPLWLRVF